MNDTEAQSPVDADAVLADDARIARELIETHPHLDPARYTNASNEQRDAMVALSELRAAIRDLTKVRGEQEVAMAIQTGRMQAARGTIGA